MISSWKQSAVGAVAVIGVIAVCVGLQTWSLNQSSGPEPFLASATAPPAESPSGAVPSPTPATNTVAPAPIGIDWTDRLAVYTGEVATEFKPDRTIPVRAIVTWDLTAGKLAASFAYSGMGEYPVAVALAGHSVVFATETQVVQSSLDGVTRRHVFAAGDGNVIEDIAVSPDWRSVAILVAPKDAPRSGSLRIFALQDSAERLVLQQSDPRFAAMWGFFWKVQWRADGTGVLVHTATQSEMYGALATVFVDGRVRVEDVQGYGDLSPSGTMLAGDVGEVGCIVGTHQLVLRNLDTGATPLSLGSPTTVYTPWEWSPDGTQFVFLERATAPCDQLSNERATTFLVSPLGPGTFGAPSKVSDLAALHRQWYGDSLFTADCDRAVGPVFDGVGKPYPLCYLPQGPVPYTPVTVRVGGVAAGMAVDPVPVGVIKP